jgi:hypothetical protein
LPILACGGIGDWHSGTQSATVVGVAANTKGTVGAACKQQLMGSNE